MIRNAIRAAIAMYADIAKVAMDRATICINTVANIMITTTPATFGSYSS